MKVAVDTQRNGAIGVICADRERPVVMEFFECFKTAWEFYRKDELYDVVITTGEVYVKPSKINSKVLVVYGSQEGDLDRREDFSAGQLETGSCIDYNGTFVPIYGNMLTFGTAAQTFIRTSSGGTAGFRLDRGEKKVIRIGYDLFREVEILLTAGQPVGFAGIPTLDVHISVLRNCILDSGIPVVEIPPVPVGHDCIACLTHDVDFLRVTDHGLDHTILGFLYRATIGSIVGFVKGQIPWTRLIQNWKAALSLPVVHAGLGSDFWFEDFERYIDIEKDLGSTFFFIPFKNSPGDKVEARHSRRRAAKYDVRDASELIASLEQQGFEIGVHGIDAWHSREGAAKEQARISDLARASAGIRMHWLCFGENSWQILDEVGFRYDSTFGYNDAIGYRAGTTQVFRPLGVKNLLELPMHIQDVVLFEDGRSEAESWKACESILDQASVNGGVVTVLWHTRSLAPERFWGEFYGRLVDELKRRGAWFATAGQVVEWFQKRRSLSLRNVRFSENGIRFGMKNEGRATLDSQFVVRVHLPHSGVSAIGNRQRHYHDHAWRGEPDMDIHFEFQ